MNFIIKVELSAVLLVTLQQFVFSDEFSNKCPEFNPQNELDIDLVSFFSSSSSFYLQQFVV